MNKLLLALLALAPAAARADTRGDEVLAAVDKATARPHGVRTTLEVGAKEHDKPTHELVIVESARGDNLLWELTAPADMKGTKLLVLSPTQIYVFLPAFGKVRRVASQTGEAFMGLSLSVDDIATVRLADTYTAAVSSEDAASLKLTATPKAGASAPYAKIELTVSRKDSVPTALVYYGADGAKVRSEERLAWECQDGCAWRERRVSDVKSGSTTMFRVTSRKLDDTIGEATFAKKALAQ